MNDLAPQLVAREEGVTHSPLILNVRCSAHGVRVRYVGPVDGWK